MHRQRLRAARRVRLNRHVAQRTARRTWAATPGMGCQEIVQVALAVATAGSGRFVSVTVRSSENENRKTKALCPFSGARELARRRRRESLIALLR